MSGGASVLFMSSGQKTLAQASVALRAIAYTPAWLALLPVLVACTDVADERAERDEAIGHYQDAHLRVDVDGGLAVVRHVEAASVLLWSSAPAWSATLRLDRLTPLELEIRNVMAGSTLAVSACDGALVSGRLLTSERPTQRRYALDAPAACTAIELVAPPPDPAASRVRFAVLSDVQEGISRVQDIYSRMNEEPGLDFVIGAGDLTSRGTRAELERFESELQSLSLPYYTTLGNHELAESPPPYQDIFGRANLHFHFRDVAFSLVDSGSATLAPKVLDWLDAWLDEDRARVHVFATHYPLVDPVGVRNGSFASRPEAHQIIARLAAGRVDLGLHGHVHSYYSYTMADIQTYISGGGGAIPERFDGIGRHFLVVDVAEESIGGVRVVRVD